MASLRIQAMNGTDSLVLSKYNLTWASDMKMPHPFLYELKLKTYSSKEERFSWVPRILMLLTAIGNGSYNGIFSLSIEPEDPTCVQTFFYKHKYCDPSTVKAPLGVALVENETISSTNLFNMLHKSKAF